MAAKRYFTHIGRKSRVIFGWGICSCKKEEGRREEKTLWKEEEKVLSIRKLLLGFNSIEICSCDTKSTRFTSSDEV